MAARYFADKAAWRTWLARHHADAAELTLGLYKKGSGKTGITYAEALDEALCFGWIDGLRKAVDAERWTIRFTPRRPSSIWSAVNLKRYAALAEAGRVAPPGRAAYDAREPRRSGLYSYENRPAALDAHLERRFRADKKAWSFFQAQPPSYRRTAVWWVMSAKQPATRERRLAALLLDSGNGLRIKPMRKAGAG